MGGLFFGALCEQGESRGSRHLGILSFGDEPILPSFLLEWLKHRLWTRPTVVNHLWVAGDVYGSKVGTGLTSEVSSLGGFATKPLPFPGKGLPAGAGTQWPNRKLSICKLHSNLGTSTRAGRRQSE